MRSTVDRMGLIIGLSRGLAQPKARRRLTRGSPQRSSYQRMNFAPCEIEASMTACRALSFASNEVQTRAPGRRCFLHEEASPMSLPALPRSSMTTASADRAAIGNS